MSLRPFFQFPLLLGSLCLLGQCGKVESPAPEDAEVLALVGGRPITKDDLLAEAEWRRNHQRVVPDAGQLLQEMVERQAMVARAKLAGFDQEPETRRRIESLMISRLREVELEGLLAEVEIGEDEVRAAYEGHPEQFSQDGLDRFSILSQRAHSKLSEDRRAEARERLEEAVNLADKVPATGGRGAAASGFGVLSVDYSDDQLSRYRGGDIGWLKSNGAEPNRLPEELLKVGRALEKGARSEVLETSDGYFVIMKTDARPAGVRSYEEVAPRLHQSLVNDRHREIERNFMDETRRLAAIELITADPADIQLPPSPAPRPQGDQLPALPGASGPSTTPR